MRLSGQKTFAKRTHTLLPSEDPDDAEVPPLSGGLRAVPDASQRSLRCCWRPVPVVSSLEAAKSASSGDLSDGCDSWCGGCPCHPSVLSNLCTKDRVVLALLTLTWVSVGLVAFRSGRVIEGPEGDGLNVVQSLYLMAQIITTTGYGDLTPTTDAGRSFAAGYILCSSLVFSALIMELIDRVVDSHQQQAEKTFQQLLGESDEVDPQAIARNTNLIMATLFYSSTVLVWTVFFRFYCDETVHICEGLTLTEAFYFAVVSCCGVGFGDITPKTNLGMIFSGVVSCVGVATYLNLVGAISDMWLKERKCRRLDALSAETFEIADLSSDGVVDLYEFTRFILTRYNLVSNDIFEEIRQNFEDLDLNGSGDLTKEDMKLMFAKMRDRSTLRLKPTRAFATNSFPSLLRRFSTIGEVPATPAASMDPCADPLEQPRRSSTQ